jgi:2-polyprenyl-3-methyl-5-hydroxy-6-metoxy-1,4-benzoquinol methylase
MQDYQKLNKDLWNKWAELHQNSDFYDVEAFKNGKSSLNQTELDILGDVKGQKVLHLQCHFGLDTLSLARLGAKVTGIDISENAISIAQKLTYELKLEAEFLCSDVLSLDKNLFGEFDIVYTSYGALVWLHDLNQWAKIVRHFLKPGGKLVLVEFHPLSNMFNPDFTELQYTYFKSAPVQMKEEGSYADFSATHVKGESVTWDFSLSEVISALLNQNLQLLQFQEYDFSHYDLYPNSVKNENGFQIKGLEGKLPLMFSVVAKKLA